MQGIISIVRAILARINFMIIVLVFIGVRNFNTSTFFLQKLQCTTSKINIVADAD